MDPKDQPHEQAAEPRLVPSPTSGVVPPVEHRFKKGKSGNPGGMPKGSYNVRDAVRRILAENADEDGIGKKARKMADDAIRIALDELKGDREAMIRWVTEQACGKLESTSTLKTPDLGKRIILEGRRKKEKGSEGGA